MLNLQTRYMTITTKAIPPITPPTIAPMGFDGVGVCPGRSPILMHTVEAHWVHDSAFKEHV
jgi:hypothetical protein